MIEHEQQAALVLELVEGDTLAKRPVQVICPLSVHLGATWSKDDVIVLAPANRDGLYRVPASGGTLEPITKIDPAVENSHRWPHFLPDGPTTAHATSG